MLTFTADPVPGGNTRNKYVMQPDFFSDASLPEGG